MAVGLWLINYYFRKVCGSFYYKIYTVFINESWMVFSSPCSFYPSQVLNISFVTTVACQILRCDLSTALPVQYILVGSSVPGCSAVCFLLYWVCISLCSPVWSNRARGVLLHMGFAISCHLVTTQIDSL